jgi:hypothetical protein
MVRATWSYLASVQSWSYAALGEPTVQWLRLGPPTQIVGQNRSPPATRQGCLSRDAVCAAHPVLRGGPPHCCGGPTR